MKLKIGKTISLTALMSALVFSAAADSRPGVSVEHLGGNVWQ